MMTHEKFSSFSISFFQVVTLATIITKNTSTLCNAARDASSNTTNPIARRHFVQSAKDVANSTAELVRTIKVGFISLHFKKKKKKPSMNISSCRFWIIHSMKIIIDNVSNRVNHCSKLWTICIFVRRRKNYQLFQL